MTDHDKEVLIELVKKVGYDFVKKNYNRRIEQNTKSITYYRELIELLANQNIHLSLQLSDLSELQREGVQNVQTK